MTETDWNVCTDVLAMLEFLHGRVSVRKLRLFACASCRKVADCLTEETRALLAVAEQFADGQISSSERKTARAKALDVPWSLDPKWAHQRGREKSAVAWALDRSAFTAAGKSASCAAGVLFLDYAHILDLELTMQNPSEESVRVATTTWDAARTQVNTVQCAILRCIIGNPFHPATIDPSWLAWNDAVVVRLVQAAYDNRILPSGALDNACLAILADALEEAGCSDERILPHLRSSGEHYRGCFVVDALLGKS